jgi:hypothetical protein
MKKQKDKNKCKDLSEALRNNLKRRKETKNRKITKKNEKQS